MPNVPDVAICADSDALDRLGPALRHLAVGLVDQGVRIRLLSSDARIESLSLGPIQAVVHPPLHRLLAARRLSAIREALADRPPNLIHAASAGTYELARELADGLDVERVLTVSSLTDCRTLGEYRQARPPHLAASSAPLRDVLVHQLAVPPERISLIRPGVLAGKDPACFAHDDYTASLLCASPLDRGARVDLFIETVALLHRRQRAVLGFVIGEGPGESALRKLVRRRDVASQVIFTPAQRRTAEIMDSADLFVVPATGDALSIPLLQAMGAGLACVVAEQPLCDFVVNGATARICAEAAAHRFADAIEEWLDHRDQARALAASALQYVRDHHTVSETAELTAALYRRLTLPNTTYAMNR